MAAFISRIDCHPYPCEVWFTNSERLHNQARRKHIGRDQDLDLRCAMGMVSGSDNRQTSVIGVFDGSDKTLVHECGHAVVNVFHYVGMEIDAGTTEAFAYLLESFYKQCSELNEKWGGI